MSKGQGLIQGVNLSVKTTPSNEIFFNFLGFFEKNPKKFSVHKISEKL